MNDTNRMVSVPSELLEQALDAAAAVGLQDVADELDRILTPTTRALQISTAALWRHREKIPGRVWNYTKHWKIAEKAIRLGHEVQGFADLHEIERLSEESLHHRNLQIEADDLIKSLRVQLAELKRRHDGLHRDMLTIASRVVPKGCTVADFATAAIAEALPASEDDEARHG
ncbi:hypothetical protein [Pseudomonas putida]|uniref:Uncharacterized protein n=1 Tax=Pseudomonas putida TaxID=303 RepID=A0A1X0ZSM4_PSEPU|nr:hypothetical protein [Pseudomonas putida]ORL62414.1 hypothetical protein B7H17_18510 [Pseudomonas putida]